MRREFLDKVLDKETTQEIRFQHSGKYADSVSFDIGQPLRIRFEDGSILTHETIIDVLEDDYGYWIETTKKLWKFDYNYSKLLNIQIIPYAIERLIYPISH